MREKKPKIISDLKKYVPYPTLSELIEECGVGKTIHGGLSWRDEDGWCAWVKGKDECNQELETSGVTAEEAVANLWLKLNKK